ncbi:MAG: patatin-like phospholipase family protein [Bryobacteraceae bacterium]
MTLVKYLLGFTFAFGALYLLFPRAYQLRVPLLCGAMFVAFPYLATKGPLRAFGHGMFELGRWDLWQVAFVALTTAASLLMVTDMIVTLGAERFAGTPRLWSFWAREIIQWPVRLSLLSTALGAMYFLGAAHYIVRVKPAGGWGGQAILELAIAAAAFVAAVWAPFRLAQAWHAETWLATLFRNDPNGYINPATDVLYPAHVIAAALGAASLLVYFAFGWIRYRAIAGGATISVVEAESARTVPTLAWVIFLVLIACWVLAGATFMLDARRLPVLLPIAILLGLCGYFFEKSDHVFPVSPPGFAPAAARELLEAPKAGVDPNTIIIVAASGGGIQAAAWTATVFEGLVRAFPERFAKHVRLVSGVSGGSVGLMYCVAAYRDGDIPHRELSTAVLGSADGDPLFRLASAASLDYAAWGFAFPDFFRSWIPVFSQEVDRAWALSRAWVRYRGMESLADATLGKWAEDARRGARPAVVFNATIAETGARYLLSTFHLRQPLVGRREFATSVPERDIHAATAARLSAAFPYVSPASRAAAPCGDAECGHVIDGGYYDNYGIASVVDFVREGLPDVRGKRVMLVQIEVGPFGDREVGRTDRGWFYQLLAPPLGLLHVWGAAMRSRNEVEVALLKESIRLRAGSLQSVRVDFPYEDTPTSWYLTREEKARIGEVWTHNRGPETIKAVAEFLAGATPP